MIKRSLSIFFTLLFMAFTVVPSILVMVDNSIDISILMSVSEEEEEQGKYKKIEVLAEKKLTNSSLFLILENKNSLAYTFKHYTKPHLNLISPPPDFSS